MLDIKQWIKKVTEWINDHENPRWDYVGNVGSTLFNGTWIAPDDGMVVLNANCSGSSTSNAAYWYVSDSTLNIALANLFWISGSGTWRSASFPVIKGHAYSSSAKARILNANAYFFKLGGVVHRLLNTLQSLAYRGGGASVECKELISQNAYPTRRLLGCGGTNTKLFVQKPAVWWFSIRCIKDWVYTFGCCGLHLFSSRLVLLKYRLTGNTSKYIYIQKFKYNSVSKFNIEGIISQRLTASVKGVAVC